MLLKGGGKFPSHRGVSRGSGIGRDGVLLKGGGKFPSHRGVSQGNGIGRDGVFFS